MSLALILMPIRMQPAWKLPCGSTDCPSNPTSRGKLIDGLLGDYLEPALIEPTFLYSFCAISPRLPKACRATYTVERFEDLFAA